MRDRHWTKFQFVYTRKESEYRGDVSQHNKSHIQQDTANTILNVEKLSAFPLRSGKISILTLTLLFNTVLEILAQKIWQQKS